MTNSYIQLQSSIASLVVKLTPAPEVLYWGKRIAPIDNAEFEQLCASIDRGVSQARVDHDVPLTLCPEIGRANFNAPGIEGHHDGENWAPIFSYQSHIQQDNRVVITCLDAIAKLAIDIELVLDVETGVLSKTITLTNNHKQAYDLNKLSLTVPVPYRAKELESYSGRWIHELQPQRSRIEHGAFTQENRRGKTSHEYFPGCLVGTSAFNNQHGEVWGFHLAWSGNHHWRFEAKSDGRRFVQTGELLMAGEIQLQQGESYSTPTLYSSYSCSGINGLRKSNHQYVRNHILILDSERVRPVHLNTWEGIYFDHDPKYICEMATQAKQIGVERFIIDDGWFKGRNNDKAALGDWELDKSKYPNGLKPVIEHVNQLGMEFGIWVEPEMVNPDSDLFRAHPEWVLSAQGYQQPTSRNQFVLNLQIEDCFNYLYNCLDSLLSDNNIGYLKWDMNRELVQPTHNGKASIHGQTKAVYRLLDKLRSSHPRVEIESCSSGGGRVDYEILKRTHRFWASDCNDALERQTIQQSMSIFFPPEVTGSHIGPHTSHTTRRQHHINLRGNTALFGHMGVELDPVKESEEEKAAFAHYIGVHKRFRNLVHKGEIFYLDSADETRVVNGVQKDDEMLVSITQKVVTEYMLAEPLFFVGLDTSAIYEIELVDFPKHSGPLMKRHPEWSQLAYQGQEVKVSGEYLVEFGLSLPLQDPETSIMIYLKKA